MKNNIVLKNETKTKTIMICLF